MIAEYPTRDTIRVYGFVYIGSREQLTYGPRIVYMAHRDRAIKRNHTHVQGRQVSRDWLEKNNFFHPQESWDPHHTTS